MLYRHLYKRDMCTSSNTCSRPWKAWCAVLCVCCLPLLGNSQGQPKLDSLELLSYDQLLETFERIAEQDSLEATYYM